MSEADDNTKDLVKVYDTNVWFAGETKQSVRCI